MARLLVVNADDLGASEGINDGIARAHREGIVTSASLMVDRPAAVGAGNVVRQLPQLSVGLHFEHVAGTDLDDPTVLATEMQRQLTRFRELTGTEPTHLDSHHHVHLANGRRIEAFAALARSLEVPVRGQPSIHYISSFWGQSEDGATDLTGVAPAHLDHLLREQVKEGVNELGCHPAASVTDLKSSYAAERLIELQTLTSPGLRDRIAAQGIDLVSFREAARARAKALAQDGGA